MSEELSDAQMDAILDGSAEAAPQEAEVQAQPQAQPDQHQIRVGGKDIDATIDQLKRWAQQGYHYSQQKHELDQQAEKYKTYMQIDEYANSNPEWWKFVQSQWQGKEQWKPGQESQMSQQSESSQDLSPIMQELQELKQWRQEMLNREQAERQKQEDQALDQQISSIKEKYGNMDWTSADDDMMTLEDRVIKFANEKGINDFEAAFKAYNFDNMIINAQEKGKMQLSKDIQKQKQMGIIGKSSTPKTGLQDASNLKSKSYQDLANEALQELGLG